jgi:uncharacterized protein YprB with RNaseH-like and TPR domain
MMAVKCEKCKILYPSRFIEFLVINSDYTAVCPQCALDEINKAHGTHRTSFSGSVAQELYENFLKYKKKRKQP